MIVSLFFRKFLVFLSLNYPLLRVFESLLKNTVILLFIDIWMLFYLDFLSIKKRKVI